MEGRYVFAVRFRLDPSRDVDVEPRVFETRMTRRADDPGEPGWLFFRDNLWRGEISDQGHFRELTAEALDVPVEHVDYRAFEVDDEYYAALKEAVGAHLDLFKADSVPEALNKYLGSSVEVAD